MPEVSLPRRITLLDGSMGQELIHRGAGGNSLLWAAEALFKSPGTVRDIHQDYIRAGADIITTNSYSTIRHKFEAAGLMDRFVEMNQLAGQLAVEARAHCERPVLIAGSLPPQRGSYRPDRVGAFIDIEPLYREQADLLAPYVDFFICETMSTAGEARAAAVGALATGKPVWVSWTLEDTCKERATPLLRSGERIKQAFRQLEDLAVSAFLVNCSMPEAITPAIPALASLSDFPVGAYANAFTPIPEKWDYQGNQTLPPARTDLGPRAYAAHAARWIDAGARIIGGCCEVGPAHIKALNQLIASFDKS